MHIKCSKPSSPVTVPSYLEISQGDADCISVWVTCNLLLRHLLQPDSGVEVEGGGGGDLLLMRLSRMRHFPQPEYRKWYLSVQRWNLLQTCETKKNLKKTKPKWCRASLVKSDFISNNSTFQRKVRLYLSWHIMGVSKITLPCKYLVHRWMKCVHVDMYVKMSPKKVKKNWAWNIRHLTPSTNTSLMM